MSRRIIRIISRKNNKIHFEGHMFNLFKVYLNRDGYIDRYA